MEVPPHKNRNPIKNAGNPVFLNGLNPNKPAEPLKCHKPV